MLAGPSLGSNSTPRAQVRRVVQAYLDATARGDGARACRLLSPAGRRDGGYRTLKACVRAYRHAPGKVARFAIDAVRITGPRSALVTIGDAAVSGNGNDVIAVHRYRSRWLIDTG
jgi:hypothetical protein